MTMKLLIDLKCIVANRLPEMPKEYIVRLLFDTKHESLILLKRFKEWEKVIGGIIYKVFEKQGFAEIAFLSIIESE